MTIFKNVFQTFITLNLMILFGGYNPTFGQNINTGKFQYIFPVPSSKLNSTKTNIIVRFGDAFDYSVLSKNPLQLAGNIGGNYTGRTILAENNRTLIFYPDNEFRNGEIVTVTLKENLKTVSNEPVPGLSYSFETSKKRISRLEKKNYLERYIQSADPDMSISKSYNVNSPLRSFTVQQDSLPHDFPEITIDTINNPTPGNIFFTPFTIPSQRPTFLIITDNYGVPLFYQKANGLTFDFKKQPTGVLTYFKIGQLNQFYVLDSSYNIIDSLRMIGYPTDVHELIVLKNGNAFMMCYDIQPYAMDTVVEGGNAKATVMGLVIQELDENKNIVFQWRSWDHFKITDATSDIDLLDSTAIDYVHGNAIEMDYDGNILISSRNMDEVTKISRETGKIIWRWGGEHCENNEFTFINDPIGFSHQHDVRRLPNGNITIFDNGNLHDPPFSRVAEYQLDEVNKLAFLVWEYRNDPEIYSAFMGSARRFENHNTFIGWGSSPSPAISEVNAEGKIELQISFPDTIINYRAFKFPWKTSLFTVNPDPLFFKFIYRDDIVENSFVIRNNSDQEIEINGLLNRNSAFEPDVSLPIKIAPLDSASIDVIFRARDTSNYFDTLYLQWNKENERITQIITLIASTDPSVIASSENNRAQINFSLDQNYPNPFNPRTTIGYHVAAFTHVVLKVYDILGNEIAVLVNEEKSPGNYKIEFLSNQFASGVYYYTLSAGNFSQTKKMLILK